ncbi:hypothetical protein C3404_27180 [Citrobacter freundii complex sp. CFNIH11]|nr:hypothetical protein C3404_27180 [Citrobacter freundii complex sp. CFNIH11]
MSAMFSMIVLRMKACPQHSTGKEGVTISLNIGRKHHHCSPYPELAIQTEMRIQQEGEFPHISRHRCGGGQLKNQLPPNISFIQPATPSLSFFSCCGGCCC